MSDTEYLPLKGDPELLLAKANHYASIADAITRSVTTLKKIHQVDDMKSKATEALKDKSGDVADDIDKARDRYKNTASALITYAHKLRTAKDAADTAITHINQKQTEASQAHHAATNAEDGVATASDTEKSDAQKAADKAADAATTAQADLRAAQQEWHAALQIKNDAADVAVAAIVEVVEGKKNNGLEDGWWDDWGSKVLDVIKVICDIAGFLSIFLAWVPILGAVLVALAILGAVIALVEAIVKFANGEGSLTDVIFAAVGVVLAAFGGKIAAYLGKLVKFQAATKVMTKGSDFLNRKGFKLIFGESKAALRSGKLKSLFSDGPGFKTMMNDIKNPFDLKLGTTGNLFGKFTDGAATNFAKFIKNPLSLQSIENGAKVLSTAPLSGAKVAMVAMDVRKVASTGEKLYNAGDDLFFGGDDHITLKPESVIQIGVNNQEKAIRSTLGL
ncbi:putative T7SS-secreted protein [Lacisediminihabitans changchengi]|uniref:Putative T7SS secretion signal domain-containing protein n=1 Tax=Lacisediminihabitans changchengi TaxID=2787634 RepID=A0A934W2Z2_9MICO|nr:hypothetical protein [Lacisediminihabitans changchengi]MBK4348408.1 hypothetical protein [Lacisediminihabitans changchengi]